jgi:RecJ-like exonuclease
MALAEPANRAAELLQGQDLVRVLCHADGDGLAAAGILIQALRRAGVDFHVTALDRLERGDLRELAGEDQACTALLDLPVGHLPVHEAGEHVLVVDHHPLPGEDRPRPAAREDDVLQVQARERTGTTHDACAAAVTLLVARALDEANLDLYPLAAAGAVADRQHVGGLTGLNAELLAEAREAGLEAPADLLVHPDAGLLEALAREPAPFLPNLGGRARAIQGFLDRWGLDPDAAAGDLDAEGRRRLATALTLHLLDEGAAPGAADDLVGPRIPAPVEGVRSAHDLAFLLEHAGRAGSAGAAVGMLLGEVQAREKVRDLARKRADRLVQRLIHLEREGLDERGPLRVLELEDRSLLTMAVDLAQPTLAGGRPTVGVEAGGEPTLLEARRGPETGPRAPDLRTSLEAALGEDSDQVGGHDAAAWAEVPSEHVGEVLDGLAGNLDGGP